MISKVFIYPKKIDGTPSSFPVDFTRYLAGNSAIGKITSSVDNSDFVIGAFSINNCKIKFFNRDGIFSENASGGFPYGRDGSLVSIEVGDPYTNSNNRIVFQGYVDDIGSKEDPITESFEILVVGVEGRLRKEQMPVNLITGGTLSSQALQLILQDANLRGGGSVNVELDLDPTIDNPSVFNGKSRWEAMNRILKIANSYARIQRTYENNSFTENLDLYSRTRKIPSNETVRKFYGPYDNQNDLPTARGPLILSVARWNSGIQRSFNRISFNDESVEDPDYIQIYGLREYSASDQIITSTEISRAVAANILEKFKNPKQEFEIIVKLADASDISVGDIVQIYYPRKNDGKNNRVGSSMIGSAQIAKEYGGFAIYQHLGFLVYATEHNLDSFTTKLKLREYGHGVADGLDFREPSP